MTKEKLSRTFSAARVFAMLSVICAHLTLAGNESLSIFLSAFGVVGVGVFLIYSMGCDGGSSFF
jgi:hypothetical protein